MYQALVPAFPEFRCNYNINFILFDFHDYFDGVLGLQDLVAMSLNIDLTNQKLIGNNLEIPFFYRQPTDTAFTLSVSPGERIIKSLPVNIFEGEIHINETQIDELYIPEILTTSNNGFAPIEIQNHTNRSISVTLKEPISASPFESIRYEIHNFESFCDDFNRTDTNSKINIDNLLRINHLNAEEKSTIINLCNEYSDIFYKSGDDLTFTSKIKHEIKTTDEIPIHSKSYRYPYVHKQEVKKQINEMLEKGIIRPSSSPWSSPIWIVAKKPDASGQQKWRLVVDYRKINEKTIDDRYPIPNIIDVLDKLGRAQYFSALDLASGFHQIEMNQNSIEKTAFSVENGHYEYLRMPFGLKNAPSTFQRVMDEVLKDLQNKICMVYMDDIIIFSTGLQEHIQNLRLVFSKLRESNFKIQLDKSEFLQKQIEFLGHIVTPDGIKPHTKKIEVIKRYPIPKTQKEIKSFLGLLGYYRRFIQNFAKLTKPMTRCLKKNQRVEHTPEFIECFEACKSVLTSEPVLAYPNFEKPFELTTDASNFAIGAILSQDNHPISYASRTLNPTEINYPTHEKELLAIVWACKYFRPYLFGHKFVINTDHKPLVWLFSLKQPNSRLIRWRLMLDEFDYTIKYKKGKENQAADALSRNPPKLDINTLETTSLDVNIDDLDSIIRDELEQITDLPILDSETISDVLGEKQRNKIEILSDIQLKPPTKKQKDKSDGETVHTSLEDPILNIPISEKPLNQYKNQIFITVGEINKIYCRKSKVFENTRFYVTLPKFNLERSIVDFLKNYVDSKRSYAIYLQNPQLLEFFTVAIQNYFKNSTFKLIMTTKFLTDVETIDEQNNKLEYHHVYKSGHRGINEVKASLSNRYYWPKMFEDIQNYVNNCEVCQKNKYDRDPPVVKFNLTPTASKPFEHIHADVFRISSQPYLTIIDSFSRYGQAYPLKSVTGVSIVENLLNFISHHGLPKKITTDSGTEFKNNDLENFCKLHHIELHFTTAKNSNSNSPVERFHSTLIEHFRRLREENKDITVDQLIKHSVLSYNNSIHSVTKFTPFEVIKGHIDNPDPFDLNDRLVISDYVQTHKQLCKKLYADVRQRNADVKERTITRKNETRSEPLDYTNQDTVYIKTKHRDKKLPKFKKLNLINQSEITLKIKQNIGNKPVNKFE